MKIDNIFFKFLIVISILLLIALVNRNIKEMFQGGPTLSPEREAIKYCNSKNSVDCDLKRCVYSLSQKKCNAINDNLYTDKELVNEFYKETIVNQGLSKDEIRQIVNPTPFLSSLDLLKFNGINRPGYIFISEFYGNNTSIAMFFQFNEFSGDDTPLISSDNWNVNIKRETQLGKKIYFIEFKFYDDFETYSHPAKIEPGSKFYFFGLNLSRTKLTLYLMNRDLLNSNEFASRYSKGEVYELNNMLREKIDTRTTTLFVGTNLERNRFFDGYIGKFDISKNQRTINDLKRLSKFFSKEASSYDELDAGSKLSELGIETQRDSRIPSKIPLSVTLSDTSAELFWLPPEEGYDSISVYIIIMIVDENNPKRKPTIKYLFYDNGTCKKCYKKMTDLEYDFKYHFKIIGVNDNGVGIITKDDFVLVEPKKPPSLVELNKFSKTPDKISCNPDGTYNIGKSCYKNEAIIAQMNDEVHDILVDHLQNRGSYNLSPNFQIKGN